MDIRHVVAGLSVLALAWAAPVRAGEIANTSSSRWVTDGRVTDAVAQGDLVYLAGTFTRVAPRTGPLTFLDPTTGEPQPGPLVTGGDIVNVVPDGNGGYYIAGSFTTVAGVPRRSVARLTGTGAVDPVFASTAIDRAVSMVVSGDRLFVSGYRELDSFSGIVALDRVTGALLPWTPANPTAPARLFALPNGNLVATWAHSGPPYPPATNIELDRNTGAILTFWPAMPLVTVDEDTVVGSLFYSIYRVNVHTPRGDSPDLRPTAGMQSARPRL